jgi:TolB protein
MTRDPASDREPAFSPDGTKLAFASNRHGNWEIYVLDADRKVTRLTNNQFEDRNPVWSPDGTQIAFHSSRDGNREIYVMNADGSDQTNLTNSPDTDDRNPSWR